VEPLKNFPAFYGSTRGLISLWLYKENNKLLGLKIYLLYLFPPELHTLMTYFGCAANGKSQRFFSTPTYTVFGKLY
jgi:hypothetical protein